MNKIKLVGRVDKKSNELLLFFYDNRQDLNIYTSSEGHSGSDYGYYKNKTRKPQSKEEKENISNLLNLYIKDCENTFIISARLK